MHVDAQAGQRGRSTQGELAGSEMGWSIGEDWRGVSDRLALPVNVDAFVVLAVFRTGDQVTPAAKRLRVPRPPHRLLSVARMCLIVMPSGAGREFDCPADA